MKLAMLYMLTLLALLMTSVRTFASNQYRVSEVDGGMPYLLHLPEVYDDNPDKAYPAIIFLHGYGERCNPNSYGTTNELSRLENAGGTIPRLVRDGYPLSAEVNGETEYFVLISPQIATDRGPWGAEDVIALLDEVSAEVRIDPERVYLTGFSFGGTGVWSVLTQSANEPNRFAGAAPVHGRSTSLNKHKKIAEDNVPIWAFTGLKDPTEHTPERVLIANREVLGYLPTADNQASAYPDVAHSCARAYNTGNFYESPNLYQWFLQHRLQEPGLVEQTNLANRSETIVTAGDVQGNYGANRVKNNTGTFWGSDTDNYDDKWVMLDLGEIDMVDAVYLRFASSTNSSLKPTSPHGEITRVEASPTSGRIRIYAPNHARRKQSLQIPADLIWIKGTSDYNGGPFEVMAVNSKSSENPNGWFEIEGDFAQTSTGTWYTLNQTTVAYRLECSENGNDWTVLAEEDDNYQFNRLYRFEARPMRYVRLSIQRPNRMDLPEFEHLSRIYEIKVLEALADLDPPSAPSALNVSDVTSGGMALDWTAPTGGVVAGYHVYWSTENVRPESPQEDVDNTSCVLTGLDSETTYYFWVSAYNSGGESAAISGSQTTLALQPPVAPEDLSVVAATASSLTLAWTDAADNEDSYRVYWSTENVRPASAPATLPAGSNTYYVDGLTAETNYYFWVVAVNAEGESPPATLSAQTLEAAGSIDVGLISHWKFDESSGATAYDTYGLADGTLTGDATRLSAGLSGGGVSLDGTDDWVEVDHQAEYSGEAFSISMWIRPAAIDSQPRGLISKRSGTASTQRTFSIFSYARGQLYIDIGPSRIVSGYFLEALTEWQHLVLVFDGSVSSDNVHLYMNGTLVGTYTISVTEMPSIDCPLTIGTLNKDYGDSFNGDIDEVRLYGRVLVSSEVAYLYANEPEAASGEVPANYAEWVAQTLDGATAQEQAPSADPDGDGIVNLNEFALGGDPTTGDPFTHPVSTLVEVNGVRYLEVSHRRRCGGTGDSVSGYSVGDLYYRVEVTDDLGAEIWESGSEWFEQIGTPVDNGDGTETVTLRLKLPVFGQTVYYVHLYVNNDSSTSAASFQIVENRPEK